jgi:serine/threonine protein phosphatase PrpC
MIDLKSYGALSQSGESRESNEDKTFADPSKGWFGLFDGCGGGGIGDDRSAMAVKEVESFLEGRDLDEEATMPYGYQPGFLIETNAILNAFTLAHQKIRKKNQAFKMEERGAVSALLGTQTGSIFCIGSVGHCKAVRLRKGVAEQMIASDGLDCFQGVSEGAGHHRLALQALGFEFEPQIHLREFRIQKGDSLWFIGSGLAPFLGTRDLVEIAQEAERSGRSFKKALEKGVQQAASQGSMDNQSLLVLQF